jgi:hypothetical protein
MKKSRKNWKIIFKIKNRKIEKREKVGKAG